MTHRTGLKHCRHILFQGAALPPEVARVISGTGAGAIANGGHYALSIGAGAGVAALTMGDVLAFPLSLLDAIEFLVKAPSVWPNNTECHIGVGTARNDDETAISVHALFDITSDGTSHSLTLSADDNGSKDINQVAGGNMPPLGEWMRLRIDFAEHAIGGAHPSEMNSRGRGSDLAFSVSSVNGNLLRRAQSTLFDLSAAVAATNVQPIIQLAGSAAAALHVAEIAVEYSTAK